MPLLDFFSYANLCHLDDKCKAERLTVLIKKIKSWGSQKCGFTLAELLSDESFSS